MKTRFNCPAEMTVSLIGGKWKAILLYNLRQERRFGELKRRSPGITSATLTQQLRELEEYKFIQRKQVGENQLDGVLYSLTEKGRSLRPVLNAMIRWGLEHKTEHAIGDFGMAVFRKSTKQP
jgi:DNA-binding HxlR family transcriptional regulator